MSNILEIESLNDELSLHIETSEVKPDKEDEIALDVMITNKDGLILGFMGGDDGHATITMSPNAWENKWDAIDELNIDMDGTPLRCNRALWNLVWMHLHEIWGYKFCSKAELLAALEAMCGAYMGDRDMTADDCLKAYEDAKALIAKAKGGRNV